MNQIQEIPGYKTVDSEYGECAGCAFDQVHSSCYTRACCRTEREDRRSVIFIKVEAPVPQSGLTVYIIGSLRNEAVPTVGAKLRAAGHTVFDDWYAAGPEADDHWQAYEKSKGSTYAQALAGHAAQNVYAFDKRHLDAADAVVMVLPAGKSAHLELGYCAGKGKRTYILLDGEPERFDVMYNFATKVVATVEELQHELKQPAAAGA